MYKVIGVRAVSFTPRNESQPIEGTNLYCAYEDNRITGHGCEKFFVSPGKFVDGIVPRVNDLINVSYNRYGKIETVTVVSG